MYYANVKVNMMVANAIEIKNEITINDKLCFQKRFYLESCHMYF